jgi:hypothetical protein
MDTHPVILRDFIITKCPMCKGSGEVTEIGELPFQDKPCTVCEQLGLVKIHFTDIPLFIPPLKKEQSNG